MGHGVADYHPDWFAGAIGKLAGPLLALGSIAGFLMLMLEYDKKIKDAQKSMFVLASNSDMAWKKIGKGQTVGISQMETYSPLKP